MGKTAKLTFSHDDGGLEYIDSFQAALAPFGIYIEDITGEDDETISIILTDVKPEVNEWNSFDPDGTASRLGL
jgi:hypothetical protein